MNKTLLTREAAKHQAGELLRIVLAHQLPPGVHAALGNCANWLGALSKSDMLPRAAETVEKSPDA